MSYESDLTTLLKPLVGNRVSPVVFPQAPAVPTWPAIRYTFISTVPVTDQCGDGDDDTAEVRVQLDVVAATFYQVRALRLLVMAAMRTFTPPAILENTTSTYDAETKTHREIMEYTFHGSTPAGSP